MKRTLIALMTLLVTLFIPTTSHATTGSVVGCSSILVSKTVTKGISLPCLDNKTRGIYQAIRGPVVVNVFGSV